MKTSTTTCFSSVSSAAEVLRYLFPVQAMLHVGAGHGHAASKKWQTWDIPHVLFIEANPEYKESLQETADQHDGWQAVSALIGEQEAEAEFYEASNPWESGIIPPEQWQEIWPNLTGMVSMPLQQHRLDALLSEPPYDSVAKKINWVNIDCMPALPIIKGAGDSVKQWDIIRVRVILDNSFAGASDACLGEVISYLAPYNFRCIAVTESNHPTVGEALFVRDWKNLRDAQVLEHARTQSQVERLTKALDEGTRLAEERNKQLIAVRQGQDEQANLARERELQIESLKKERDEQVKVVREHVEQLEKNKQLAAEQKQQVENLQRQLEKAIRAQDEQAKLARKYELQIESLKKERDQQVKVVQEQVEQLEKNKQLAAEQKQQVENLQRQLEKAISEQEEQAKLARERELQIESLKKERDQQVKVVQEQVEQLEKNKQLAAEQKQQVENLQPQLEEAIRAQDEQAKLARERKLQIESLKKERDEQVELARERQNKINELKDKIEELDKNRSEMVHRQRLLDDELVKAEAQLTLITDILIREKAF